MEWQPGTAVRLALLAAPSLPFPLVRAVLRPEISGLCRLCGEFLGDPKRIHGMFQRLLTQLVSSQVVSPIVGNGGGLVGVDRKVVQF